MAEQTKGAAEPALKAVLERITRAGTSTAASPADVSLLAQALLPTAPRHEYSLAYLALSKLVTGTSDDVAKGAADFVPLLENTFGSDGLTEPLPFVYLSAALASLAPTVAINLLTRPLDSVVPTSDALTILLEAAELPSDLQPALAELLANLAGSKAGRAIVRARAEAWLQGGLTYDNDQMRALCAVAIAKLGEKDASTDAVADNAATDAAAVAGDYERLARALMAPLEGDSLPSNILPTLEGLSIVSTKPSARQIFMSSAKFVASLIELSPVPKRLGGSLPVTPRSSMSSYDGGSETVDGGLCYGLATIFVNLTSRPPVLSEEQQQIARLQRMAAGQGDGAHSDDTESNEVVDARVKTLIDAGLVGALHGIARAGSQLVRETLGRLCLNLVEDKANRMPFIRDGGHKVLAALLRDMNSADQFSAAAVFPCQALCKLVITTPPQLLFPPPHATNALNALGPAILLLIHPAATSLHRFEALMALTNLASIDGQFGDRIVSSHASPPPGTFQGAGSSAVVDVMDKVDECLLDDNTLVRRAATELLCNLTNSDDGQALIAGESAGADAAAAGRARTRLNILLALTDVDDASTRMAAAGVLAIVTASDTAVRLLDYGAGLSSSSGASPGRTIWQRLVPLVDAADLDMAQRGALIVVSLFKAIQKMPKGDGKYERLVAEIRASTLGAALSAMFMAAWQADNSVGVYALESMKVMKLIGASDE